MQSNRARLMLVALFGVLALGALTAAAAQAVEAPRWSINGTDLAEGKTHYISTKAFRPFLLAAGLIRIECTVIKLKEGSLLGSAAGNAGKDNEVIEISTCNVTGKVSGKPIEKCKVKEPIVTRPIKSELVETAGSVPEKSGSLLTLFKPAEGVTFVTLEFITEAGGDCPPTTKVTGQVLGQVLTDPGELLVELPSVNSAEANSWLIKLPATAIRHYIKISGGKASGEETTEPLEFGILGEAALEGTALVLLAKKNATTGLLETEEAKWSPLP